MVCITSSDNSVITAIANSYREHSEIFVDELMKDLKGTWTGTPDFREFALNHFKEDATSMARKVVEIYEREGWDIKEFADFLATSDATTVSEFIRKEYEALRNEVISPQP